MDTASGSPQAYPSTPGMYNLTTQAEGHTVYYTLRIPAGYDGHTALPVILCLHFGGQPNEFYGGRFLGRIPIPGFGSLAALLVAPTTDQSGWATPTGEVAAFAALAAVEQHLRVDTRRRVVMGYSMGGSGTWHMAAKFRQHFVAAIPNAGPYLEFSIEQTPWTQAIYTPELVVRDGKVPLPDGPGWGVTINRTWLEQSQHAVSKL